MYPKLTELDVSCLREIVGEKYVLTGDAISEDYAHDELGEVRAFPEVLVEPGSAEEVAQVLRYAYLKGFPVTTRGAGTGLVGGCVPLYGGVLLTTRRLNRILEIDTDNLMATVEAGVVLMDFQETVEKLGLLYAPDPGEKSATIGGNVATNAGGMRAVKYGVTRDHVVGLEVVLPTGEIVQLGGKVAKTSSGYSLLHLMIGSEGTLGVITKVTVKLLPRPAKVLTLLVPFASLEQAIETVPQIMRSRLLPQAIELVERDVLLSAERFLGKPFPHRTSPAYLILRFDGNPGDIEANYEATAELLLEAGAQDVLIADTVDRQEGIWNVRGAFLEALKAESEMDEVDVVVPKSAIAEFIKFTKELEAEFGVRIRSFGHAGDGNLHIYILRDELDRAVWKSRMEKIMELLYAKSRELGGQVSGEHGIGLAKKEYLKARLSRSLILRISSIPVRFSEKKLAPCSAGG